MCKMMSNGLLCAAAALMPMAFAGNVLPANSSLQNGQYIQSTAGAYKMVKQADGSLVVYRQDGTVRYSMAKNGRYAWMQGDGNFVEYTSSMVPLWSTNTAGNAGSFLAIQDDGNLVVYAPNGPIWSIGIDTRRDPVSGDVVGRDMASTGIGPLGHLGLYDGSQVIEASSDGTGQGLHLTPLSTFKLKTTYWGAAHANIPGGWTNYHCYYAYCPSTAYQPSAWTRDSIAHMAYQQYLIGADYTIVTAFRAGVPASEDRPARRGLFRCDTFVLFANWAGSSFIQNQITPEQTNWLGYIRDLTYLSDPTPHRVFDSIKSYQ